MLYIILYQTFTWLFKISSYHCTRDISPCMQSSNAKYSVLNSLLKFINLDGVGVGERRQTVVGWSPGAPSFHHTLPQVDSLHFGQGEWRDSWDKEHSGLSHAAPAASVAALKIHTVWRRHTSQLSRRWKEAMGEEWERSDWQTDRYSTSQAIWQNTGKTGEKDPLEIKDGRTMLLCSL